MSLDKRDLMLIEELNNDARQPVRALARKLGMTRSTVRYRLKRLIDKRILSIYCVRDEGFAGYHFLLLVGIKVTPGEAEVVAEQLVPLPEVRAVFLAAGRYNVIAWTYIQDSLALEHFVSDTLAGISAITDIEIMHSYQWVTKPQKYSKPGPITTRGGYKRYVPSDLELSIIKAMQLDPRQPITKLAKTVGCNKSTAKTSLERLLNNGVLRFFTSIDQTALGYNTGVAILIKSKPDKIHAVANELLAQNPAMYVSLITGQWHIYLRTLFQDNSDLYRFLSDKLPTIAGVVDFEVIHLGKILKFSTSLANSA